MCQKGILRGQQSGPLDRRIDDAIESYIIPIMRFAPTLHRNIDVLRNAIELPWNNGQTKGQINIMKNLKRDIRACYPELLRFRMLRVRHTD